MKGGVNLEFLGEYCGTSVAMIERSYGRFLAESAEGQIEFTSSRAKRDRSFSRWMQIRCLYTEEKFQSEAERKLAVILDRDASRWFKPAKGQFQIFYRSGADHLEYQPDFVAETVETIYMLEPKARNELDAADVQAKKAAAVQWCRHASEHAASYKGKPWRYALIPHDVIAENMTLSGLVSQFATSA